MNLYQHGNPILCLPLLFQTLRLSNSAIGKTTTGQIVNLLSNDVNRFDKVSDQGILFISHWVQLFGSQMPGFGVSQGSVENLR